ncbi:MAG: GNAT family N-acetyltransferase [Bacteroidales bacterium]
MIYLKKNRHVERAIQRLKQTHKSYKSLGLIRFITHALYIKQETLLLLKSLDELSPYESLKTLQIISVDKDNKADLVEFYRLANISISNPEILINNYLNDECKCFFATKNEKFIGFLWWGDKHTDVKHCLPILRYIHKKVLKKNDDALGIDFFILPEERGGGAALEFYAKACRKLNHLGYKRIFGTVLSDNRPARWTYNLLGLAVIKKITIHRLLIYRTFIRTTDI